MWGYGKRFCGGSWLPKEKKANMWPERRNSGGSWPPAFPRSPSCSWLWHKKWTNHCKKFRYILIFLPLENIISPSCFVQIKATVFYSSYCRYWEKANSAFFSSDHRWRHNSPLFRPKTRFPRPVLFTSFFKVLYIILLFYSN